MCNNEYMNTYYYLTEAQEVVDEDYAYELAWEACSEFLVREYDTNSSYFENDEDNYWLENNAIEIDANTIEQAIEIAQAKGYVVEM